MRVAFVCLLGMMVIIVVGILLYEPLDSLLEYKVTTSKEVTTYEHSFLGKYFWSIYATIFVVGIFGWVLYCLQKSGEA
jgi:uncharacterized BrkB/YihY/UPF0761 family membrane protein